ncbi:MAG: HAMP domain-containing histidine kinase [Planctomycetes bacterium]|nr:HAMP domain-containing histidine kinase [Planctomycetota bacterium]
MDTDLRDQQLVLYARDLKRAVDAERRKSKELAEAKARLEILDRLKRDFLDFISHELRTPLSALSAIELFPVGGDRRDQEEVIRMVKTGYERLARFITRGLEYFDWLAAGKPEAVGSADLASAVRAAADALPGLSDARVRLEVPLPEGPCRVRGEEAALAEVARVLLDNALKFSPEEARIRLEVRSELGMGILRVQDRGVGFPPELAREIFRPFTIARVTHHGSGSGLSLALAKVIVEAYGGRIRGESAGVRQGATFTVELPAADDERTAETP